MGEKTYRIIVCRGPDCSEERNSAKTYEEIKEVLSKHGLTDRVKLLEISCFGKCRAGPNVVIGPRREDADFLFGEADEYLYSHVNVEEVEELIEKHIKQNEPLERLLWRESDAEDE